MTIDQNAAGRESKELSESLLRLIHRGQDTGDDEVAAEGWRAFSCLVRLMKIVHGGECPRSPGMNDTCTVVEADGERKEPEA